MRSVVYSGLLVRRRTETQASANHFIGVIPDIFVAIKSSLGFIAPECSSALSRTMKEFIKIFLFLP